MHEYSENSCFLYQVKKQNAIKEEVKKLIEQEQQKNVPKNIAIEGSPIEV